MKRFVVTLLLLCFALVPSTASADWRWADPHIKKPSPQLFGCKNEACKTKAKRVARLKFELKIAEYHYKKEREWDRWVKKSIPRCTWFGESGPGPEFAPARYVLPNSTGSGALGKFQLMPGTYHSFDQYGDWSALDQEIAARQLYWAQGISPWEAC